MRCFLAAWPDAATRVALAEVLDSVRQRAIHRRATRLEDLHLTLTFVGELADDIALGVASAVSEVRFAPFEWRLELLGFFAPASVVWVGSDAACTIAWPLLELAADLRRVLDRLNVAHDARRLAQHVTLLHGVKRFTAEPIAPVTWCIDSVAMYRSTGSRSGPRYERVPA